jgi:hypothetical protein
MIRERNKLKRTIQLAKQSKQPLFGSLARQSGASYIVMFTMGPPPEKEWIIKYVSNPTG